jgi:molybdate transport system substrate-binding protein
VRLPLLAGPAAALLLTATLLTSCAPASSGSGRTDLVVFAASSLNPAFATLGKEFEASHPGVTVRFSFDGSAALVDQLKAGAPADVFASADTANMDKASSAGLIGDRPAQFTTNVLTLITPKGNPAGITGLDGSLDGKKLVICTDGVPCGTATRKLAAALGVTLEPVSEETKVSDVRTKVESGQADAGIVYVTDAQASGDTVDTLAIAGAETVRNQYVIGVPTAARQGALAAEFIEWVTGARGQDVLKAAGFGR